MFHHGRAAAANTASWPRPLPTSTNTPRCRVEDLVALVLCGEFGVWVEGSGFRAKGLGSVVWGFGSRNAG